jgi:hypothetical protein
LETRSLPPGAACQSALLDLATRSSSNKLLLVQKAPLNDGHAGGSEL